MIKNIISVNKKFMTISPQKLVQIISKFNSTKGIEIFVDSNNNAEMDYLNGLVKEIKKEKLILQVHCDVEIPLKKQIEFLRILEKCAEFLNDKIVLTFHSVFNEDKTISLEQTKEYIEELISKIDCNKFIFCIENLNNLDAGYRLKKEDLYDLITANKNIYLTYDIGHELVEYGNINYPDNILFKNIRNVHVHDFNKKGVDHFPIRTTSDNIQNIINSINELIKNGYEYNIVYEYNLFECEGDTLEAKVIDYLKSIEEISKLYKD